jgi:hypothetical protein
VKQPIAGLAGIKPRLPKPNAKLSREEAHKLDREYRIHRNQALALRNHREEMLLLKARSELITKEFVTKQASYLAQSLQQRIWYFPVRYGRVIREALGLGEERQGEVVAVLKKVATEFMESIRELPNCVEEGWLETLEGEEDHPEITATATEVPESLKQTESSKRK